MLAARSRRASTFCLAPRFIQLYLHSGREIRRIVAVDPVEQNVLFETKELLLDPMSERLAFGSRRGQRSTLFDYCKRAKWIADAGVPTHADIWLSTIEDAAGRADREREYLGRREWKQATKRTKVLPQKAAFCPTPDFSKITSPSKAFRAFVDQTRRSVREWFSLRRMKTTSV